MKKTFNDLKEIESIYEKLFLIPNFKESKLGYSFKRFFEKNKEIFIDYNDALQNCRIDNALTDEKTKAILYKEDGKNFQYSIDGLKNLSKQIKETQKQWYAKEFEVVPFICKEIPDFIILDKDEIEVLKGVILE